MFAARPARPAIRAPFRLALRAEAAAWLSLALLALLQVELAIDKSINWDEFFHFSQIHQRLRGEDVQWLQTPHVVLFSWVPSLPGSAVDHIRLIRLFILGGELLCAAMLWDMLRRAHGRQVALLGALAFLSGGYVFLHGFALRADMIAATLLTGAMWVAWTRPGRALDIAALALLCGAAFVATIKSSFYLPVFIGIYFYRAHSLALRPALLRPIVTAACITIAGLLALAFLPPARALAGEVFRLAEASLGRMFMAGPFPQGAHLLRQMALAPLLTVLIASACAPPFDRTIAAHKRWAYALFLAPLLSLAIYRNAYPYFYPFILPPAILAAAPAGAWLLRRYGLTIVAGAALFCAGAASLLEDRSVLARQQAILAGLAEIFPAPIRYIDDPGMAANFPRAVPAFASGWALENYRRRGVPLYLQAAEEAPIPLLIRNGPALRDPSRPGGFLAGDAAYLNAGFVPHWGDIWVAGARLQPSGAPGHFTIFAPGTYTLEGAALTIDGTALRPGDTIMLAAGTHHAGARDAPAVLRWGDHLPRPALPWPDGPIFSDY